MAFFFGPSKTHSERIKGRRLGPRGIKLVALTGKPAQAAFVGDRHEQRSKVILVNPTTRGRWKKNYARERELG